MIKTFFQAMGTSGATAGGAPVVLSAILVFWGLLAGVVFVASRNAPGTGAGLGRGSGGGTPEAQLTAATCRGIPGGEHAPVCALGSKSARADGQRRLDCTRVDGSAWWPSICPITPSTLSSSPWPESKRLSVTSVGQELMEQRDTAGRPPLVSVGREGGGKGAVRTEVAEN